MEIDDLKACPFCGETNLDIQEFNIPRDHFETAIVCRNCGAVGPSCVKGRHQAIDPVRERALEAWNRRHVQTSYMVTGRNADGEPVSVAIDDRDDLPVVYGTERPATAFDGEGNAVATVPAEPESDPEPEPTSEQEPEIDPEPTAEEPSIADRLREHMEANGLDIERMADQLEVSDQSVYNWMNGTCSPRGKNAERIEELLAEATGDPKPTAFSSGKLARDVDPKFAANYLQRTVAAWMKACDYDHDKAADRIGIRKQLLLNILQCKIPMNDVLNLIAKAIPELQPDLDELKRARATLIKQTSNKVAA